VIRVALVTGGGTGIGAAVARRLAADGYAVAVTGRRPEPIEEVAREIGGLAVAADTGVAVDAERVVAATVGLFGRLDALVLNAGVGGEGSLLELDPETFENVFATNVTGAFLMARAAIPHLLERRGAIVSVASVAALRAAPASLAYCSSKAALAMLTQCIALDHGPAGVRANCVCPGWVRTPMADDEMDWLAGQLDATREDAYAEVTAEVPLRRPSSPEEIAATVAWLLSTDASYVNGAVIPVDGGHTMVDVGTIAFGKVS
jgi:meso-butanediol dehydrogenase / (S,S)-butanediol dehydrogenase / diacetyl reductase